MKNTVGNKRAKKEAAVVGLTAEDLYNLSDNAGFESFNKMLETPLYRFRILKHLFEIGEISAKGFLNNSNLANVSLGQKEDGVVSLRDGILLIYDRFSIAAAMAEAGSALSAFMLDTDDSFYEAFISFKKDASDVDNKYTVAFSLAYNNLSKKLLDADINQYIDGNKELIKEAKKMQL